MTSWVLVTIDFSRQYGYQSGSPVELRGRHSRKPLHVWCSWADTVPWSTSCCHSRPGIKIQAGQACTNHANPWKMDWFQETMDFDLTWFYHILPIKLVASCRNSHGFCHQFWQLLGQAVDLLPPQVAEHDKRIRHRGTSPDSLLPRNQAEVAARFLLDWKSMENIIHLENTMIYWDIWMIY